MDLEVVVLCCCPDGRFTRYGRSEAAPGMTKARYPHFKMVGQFRGAPVTSPD